MSDTDNYFIDLMNLKDYMKNVQVVNFILDLRLMSKENNISIDQIIVDLCDSEVEVLP